MYEAITINKVVTLFKKEVMNLRKIKEGVHRKGWRERKGENDAILFSFKKRNIKKPKTNPGLNTQTVL